MASEFSKNTRGVVAAASATLNKLLSPEHGVQQNEARYRGFFQKAPVALWDEDFSSVVDMLDELRRKGIVDLRAYFHEHQDLLRQAIDLVGLNDVNEFTLELFEARHKPSLLRSLADVFLPETEAMFLEELVTLWEGRRRFESETTMRTLSGRRINVIFTVAYEGERCERTLVSIVDVTARKQAEEALRLSSHRFETLNRISKFISGTLDLERVVQTVTDIATELTGAKFGAFFYNVTNAAGESYLLYSLSGAPREAFAKLGLPRNTAVFEATFRGIGIVRSADIRADARYGKNAPHFGMPKGHLPVVSYLAVPVIAPSGEVHGGLFFGHDSPGVFTFEAEEIAVGIAAHAAIAIDNAHLLKSAQVEIGQRKRAEQNARRLASIVETSDDAIASIDLKGTITSWNRGAERLYGYSAAEVVGSPATILIPFDRVQEESNILDRVRRGDHVDHYETIRRHKAGYLIEVSLSVSPIRDGEGTILGASKIARDITERKRAEERNKLLLHEIKHRIKNSLTTVQAIAHQTLLNISDEERSAFDGRLQALARAHDLLTLQSWDRVPITDLVAQSLAPFQDSEHRRFTADGPEATLETSKAVLVGLALHELATNAIKYGALSGEAGRVSIAWDLVNDDEGARLRVHWKERGGPRVEEPSRKGFGSVLIERAIASELGASHWEFAPEGVSWSVEMPLVAAARGTREGH